MAGQYGGCQRVAAAGLGGIESALAEYGLAAGYFRRGDGHSRELGLFQGHAESEFLFLKFRAFLGGFIAVQ